MYVHIFVDIYLYPTIRKQKPVIPICSRFPTFSNKCKSNFKRSSYIQKMTLNLIETLIISFYTKTPKIQKYIFQKYTLFANVYFEKL